MPRSILFTLVAITAPLATGCDSDQSAAAPTGSVSTPVSPPAAHFDPQSSGGITGVVSWTKPIPELTPIIHFAEPVDGNRPEAKTVQLANAPAIDRFSRGMSGVVVYLREIDPTKSKPWDHPPVNVVFRDYQLHVIQGERTGRTGFVRRGESVRMVSEELLFHSLRGRGADFFSFAFPDPHQERQHSFEKYGLVELTNPAGCYWQKADLFVCDHPYYTVTDKEGRFQIKDIPAGSYAIVAWHPNWEVLRAERNPERGSIARQIYAPPLENSHPVTVLPGQTILSTLTLP